MTSFYVNSCSFGLPIFYPILSVGVLVISHKFAFQSRVINQEYAGSRSLFVFLLDVLP